MSDFVRPHYSKAPIAEAIIDIRFAQPDSITVERLAEVASDLSDQFPIKQPIRHFEIGVQADPEVGNAQFVNNQAQSGWRLISKELDRVLQLQRIGFTYSHLPPYTTWENFAEGAQRAWKVLRARFPNLETSRTAVRVINRLPVPEEGYRLSDYVTLYPTLPDKMPSWLDGSFLQIQLKMPQIFEDARATLHVVTGGDSNGTHLVLDIDLFVERLIADDATVWSVLNKLGTEKDVIFESCITDLVRKAIT